MGNSVVEGPDNALWFGSEYNGIARFDGSDWQILSPENGITRIEA
jgi:hypothetical protein